jgi:hypothetical protein
VWRGRSSEIPAYTCSDGKLNYSKLIQPQTNSIQHSANGRNGKCKPIKRMTHAELLTAMEISRVCSLEFVEVCGEVLPLKCMGFSFGAVLAA